MQFTKVKKIEYEIFENSDNQQIQFMNSFYIFFNVGSGGVQAKQLLPYDGSEIKLIVDLREVRVSFFSLQSKESRKEGYRKLKEELQSVKYLPVVVAGGDGSMMWTIEQMIEQEIDINTIILIPLPCGTGNDFSIALGWGGDTPSDILGRDFQVLQGMIRRWNRGHQVYFDIWDIKLETAPDGYILEVVKTEQGAQKQSLKDLDGLNATKLEKKMSNYCSIGVDARIGLGFDKVRTQSRCLNKVCYCLEGIKKLFLKTPKVHQVIQYMEHYHPELEVGSTLFKTQSCFEKDALVVPGDPATLICLNINSYAGGITDIWKNAKKPMPNKQLSDKTSFSDGLLEFFSFESIAGIGGERLISGNATRLAQTNGPLFIKFKEKQNSEFVQAYFQVDGQYFQVINPQSLDIEPCKQLPGGKIKVLLRD